MKEEYKEYLKCAYKNKIFLAASLAFLTSRVISFSGNENLATAENVMYWTSIPFMGLTEFGFGTRRMYRKTKKHISQHGKIHPLFRKKFSKFYCDRVGLELAVKEAGLEKELKYNEAA